MFSVASQVVNVSPSSADLFCVFPWLPVLCSLACTLLLLQLVLACYSSCFSCCSFSPCSTSPLHLTSRVAQYQSPRTVHSGCSPASLCLNCVLWQENPLCQLACLQNSYSVFKIQFSIPSPEQSFQSSRQSVTSSSEALKTNKKPFLFKIITDSQEVAESFIRGSLVPFTQFSPVVIPYILQYNIKTIKLTLVQFTDLPQISQVLHVLIHVCVFSSVQFYHTFTFVHAHLYNQDEELFINTDSLILALRRHSHVPFPSQSLPSVNH